MRRHALGALCLLSLVPIAPSLGCDEVACGYGGPGCSAPGLRGACSGALALETPTEVTFTYFDDTGTHEARVTTVSADPAVLEATRVAGSSGRFVLTAHALGPTMLTATLEGWPAAQGFALTGVSAVGCGDATSSDGGCSCASIEGFALTR